MGAFNSTRVDLRCPRCGEVSPCLVEMKFGDTSHMTFVEIGDAYPFTSSGSPCKGGRLRGENPVAFGYTECEHCGKDFHCDVWIENDRLAMVRPSFEEPPLCFDTELERVFVCPVCGENSTRVQKFEGYQVCRILCDERECYLHKIALLDDEGSPDFTTMRDSTFPFKTGGGTRRCTQTLTCPGVESLS